MRSDRPIQKRLFILLALQSVACVVILGRSIQLQVFPNKRLEELQKRQYIKTISLIPKRGVITDRTGDELAISLDVGSIYAHPHLIQKKQSTAKKIANFTGLSYQYVLKRISDRKKRFVWIKRLMPLDQALNLDKRNIKGVGVIRESKRFYPNGPLAAPLLGFVGTDGVGLEGVEQAFDQYLTGPPAYVRLSQDALGRPISVDERYFNAPREGGTIELTIDKNLQYQLEKVLSSTIKEEEAEAGTGIMMDPYTGEILAMVTTPTYDPNQFSRYPANIRRNRVITDPFEPGSIFKVFLAAAALDSGIATPKTKVYGEKGKYQIEDISIGEASGHKFEWLTVEEVIKYSSNIGAVKIAHLLGRDRFFDVVHRFGFGQKTGIDLPGETKGLVQERNRWSRVSMSNVAFGQGIGVSVIQIARALAVIANGGNLVRPFVVKRVVDRNGQTIEEQLPQVVQRVISQRTANLVKEMMVGVTADGGTGVLASIPGFVVAGKTGTAQKPNIETGGYYRDRYVSSFFGFVPADKPRFILAVFIDDPKKRHYGGQVSAPAFRKIAERALRVLEITPDGTPVHQANPSNFIAWEEKELPTILTLENGRAIMPPLTGLTVREIYQLFSSHGVKPFVKGNGVVVDQSPKAGEEFAFSKPIYLEMKPSL
ncbi:MAG TPA: penicillin-binding transpeptidase domain-containing protein [Bdellovibrionota bacterium]|nr:penicillin-binding transpeptidase domain-containing protein [Bdellovibrionota bacterium]